MQRSSALRRAVMSTWPRVIAEDRHTKPRRAWAQPGGPILSARVFDGLLLAAHYRM